MLICVILHEPVNTELNKNVNFYCLPINLSIYLSILTYVYITIHAFS